MNASDAANAYVKARQAYEALGSQMGNFTSADEERLRDALSNAETTVLNALWEAAK